jgi:hypothetical protein
VLKNRLLRRIFRSKREEVTGGLRKLHNEVLHSSPDIVRIIIQRMRWVEHVAHMRQDEMCVQNLVGKCEGK